MIFTLHPCSGHLRRQYYSSAQAEQYILHSSHLCKQYYRVTRPPDTRKQTFVKLNQVPELQDVQKEDFESMQY